MPRGGKAHQPVTPDVPETSFRSEAKEGHSRVEANRASSLTTDLHAPGSSGGGSSGRRTRTPVGDWGLPETAKATGVGHGVGDIKTFFSAAFPQNT